MTSKPRQTGRYQAHSQNPLAHEEKARHQVFQSLLHQRIILHPNHASCIPRPSTNPSPVSNPRQPTYILYRAKFSNTRTTTTITTTLPPQTRTQRPNSDPSPTTHPPPPRASPRSKPSSTTPTRASHPNPPPTNPANPLAARTHARYMHPTTPTSAHPHTHPAPPSTPPPLSTLPACPLNPHPCNRPRSAAPPRAPTLANSARPKTRCRRSPAGAKTCCRKSSITAGDPTSPQHHLVRTRTPSRKGQWLVVVVQED